MTQSELTVNVNELGDKVRTLLNCETMRLLIVNRPKRSPLMSKMAFSASFSTTKNSDTTRATWKAPSSRPLSQCLERASPSSQRHQSKPIGTQRLMTSLQRSEKLLAFRTLSSTPTSKKILQLWLSRITNRGRSHSEEPLSRISGRLWFSYSLHLLIVP